MISYNQRTSAECLNTELLFVRKIYADNYKLLLSNTHSEKLIVLKPFIGASTKFVAAGKLSVIHFNFSITG